MVSNRESEECDATSTFPKAPDVVAGFRVTNGRRIRGFSTFCISSLKSSKRTVTGMKRNCESQTR